MSVDDWNKEFFSSWNKRIALVISLQWIDWFLYSSWVYNTTGDPKILKKISILLKMKNLGMSVAFFKIGKVVIDLWFFKITDPLHFTNFERKINCIHCRIIYFKHNCEFFPKKKKIFDEDQILTCNVDLLKKSWQKNQFWWNLNKRLSKKYKIEPELYYICRIIIIFFNIEN